MKKINLVFVLLSVLIMSSLVSAATKTVNFTSNNANLDKSGSNFIIESIKYDPYPVNPGQWFDVWVKVQNIGQDDAPNLRIQLNPQYPFVSNDSLIRDYGKISGTVNAYKFSSDYDASQVVVKFRVKIADSASEGTSNLKVIIIPDSTDPTSIKIQKDLPIEIGKTKSDFDVSMQDITPQGTSFIVTNTGDNIASAITLTVKTTEGISLLGPRSETLGNLDKGDFTIAHLKVIPNKNIKELLLEISYTDNSGSRTLVEKSIPIEIPNNIEQICQDNSGNYTKWIYGVVGVFIGVILLALLIMLEKRLAKK